MPKNVTVTFDDGSSHVYQNTPDTVTPEEVEQQATQEFSKKVVNIDGGVAPEPPPPPPEPLGNVATAANLAIGMPGRIGTAFEGRKQEVAEIASDENYKIPGHQMIDLIGKGFKGPLMDTVGEVASTGVGFASDLVNPDIRQGFNDLMSNITNSDAAKQAISFYKAVDPAARRTLESIFNIANVMSPFKVKAKTGSGLRDTLESGLTVVSKGKELKRDMLRRMFQSERSKENIKDDLLRGTGELDGTVETLLDIKGVSPMYDTERNLKALNKDMNATEARILGQLGSFDKTGVFVKSTRKSFQEILVNTINNAESYIKKGVKPQESLAAQEAIMRKVDGILTVLNKKGIKPNSLRGVLELRRELDAQLTPKDWSKLGDAEKASLTLEKLLVKEMRGELNKNVSAFAEQFAPGDDTIKNLLKRQSAIYTATDNYATKTAGNLTNLTEKGAIASAFSSHPFLVYRALQSQGTSPALAFVLAAPAAINAVSEATGAARRQLSGARAPLIRGGMFYGQEEEQR